MTNIRKVRFKNKQGAEIPFSVGYFQQTPTYFMEDTTPYQTNFYEVIFFHEVEGSICLDQQSIRLENNTMIFISPYRKRKWSITTPHLKAQFLRFEDVFLHELLVDKTFLDRLNCFFKPQVPLYLRPEHEVFHKINNACMEIWGEMERYQPDSPHIVRSLVYFILTTANREYTQFHQLDASEPCDNCALRFKRLLEEHITTKQQVEDYATLLNTSRVTLNKIVKQHYGITASDMIRQRLLQEMKDRLLHTEKNITEIAFELNFPEASHFVRFFKQHTEQTPKEFRQYYQKRNSFIEMVKSR
ncbi:MAG: AraC family transcriptional regulator [Bacteroidetes bacterium]|nr:MAG: AraC family transcriptional regulator [Bacteroidota bacterium]